MLPRVSVQAPPLLACRALGPAGGGQSQGHGPKGKSATGMDGRKMTWLAGGLGLSGGISYAESTMSTRTALARRRGYQYMAALQEGNDTLSHQEMIRSSIRKLPVHPRHHQLPIHSPPPSAAPETTATPHLFQVKQRLCHAVTVAVIRQNFRQKIDSFRHNLHII